MGYDVHVTRKDEWSEEGPDISEQEWIGYVSSDPEMEILGKAEITTPKGEVISYHNPMLAIWTGHSGGDQVWFDYRRGRIVVKNPDNEILNKMISIATKLKAKVQGDGGEFYVHNNSN